MYKRIFNKALNLYRLEKYDEALILYKKALNLDKNNNIILFNYGLTLFKLKQYKRSIKNYTLSMNISYNIDININIGDGYIKLEKYKKAISYYDIVLEKYPKNIFALTNKGLAYKMLGKFSKAHHYYNKVLYIDKNNIDAHWNLSHILLVEGDLKKGFEEYEYRYLKDFTNKQIPLNIPLYQGEQLSDKKLLIYPEQGFGDNIQMIRYIPLLQKLDIDIYVLPLKELKTLFSNIENIKIIDKSEISNMDYYIKSMSLPYIFETTLKTIPNKNPYLSPIKKKLSKNLFFKSSNKKVGIFWQGEKNHSNDKNRSIPFKLISQLFKIPSIDFYSLQIDDEKIKIKDMKNIKDCSLYIKNFNDSANIIKHLDLVITIDSSIVHLSGALGVTTWLLLPLHPDWRWLLKRDNSPWYPSIKIFRQTKYNRWNNVINNIIRELNI